MRIVVLGDFHLYSNKQTSIRAMEDVRDCRPDLVIPLGDFGTSANIGSTQGLEEAAVLLRDVAAPLRPILGNHDLQRESGQGQQPKGTVETAFKRIFDLDSADGFIEFESFRLAFVSTEPQPADSCYQVQECFVSDEQFQRLIEGLEQRPGVPVMMFTHAPPLGCGLKTVPSTHVRSTNAYLDQNHHPSRWLELIRHYPEIVMWFSAHYHLSHHHANAHTVRYGTHFFLTAVHSECTRDGRRGSRVIDIADGDVDWPEQACAMSVRTLDHERRTIIVEDEWRTSATLAALMQTKRVRQVAACPVGEAPLQWNSLLPLPGERFVMASEDGYTWEVKPDWEAVMGCLHVGCDVQALAMSSSGIWSAWDCLIGLSPLNAPDRFVRSPNGGIPNQGMTLPSPIRCMASHPDGGIWLADGESLWIAAASEEGESRRKEASSLADDAAGRIRLDRQCELKEPPRALIADRVGCWIVTEDDRLFRWDGQGLQPYPLNGRVLAVDAHDGATAILLDGERLGMVLLRGEEQAFHDLNIEGRKAVSPLHAPYAQMVWLDTESDRILILLGGGLFCWEGPARPIVCLDTGADPVAAISRAPREQSYRSPSKDRVRFAFTTRSAENGGSRLQIWEMSCWNKGGTLVWSRFSCTISKGVESR